MTKASEQHEKLIEAIKAAKERNNEAAMGSLTTPVSLVHVEIPALGGDDFTIRRSLTALSCHGYEYSELELNRVLSILNNIK